MNVRLWISEDEANEIEMSTNEIDAFVELLKSMPSLDFDGNEYEFTGIIYDVHQNAFDLGFEKQE